MKRTTSTYSAAATFLSTLLALQTFAENTRKDLTTDQVYAAFQNPPAEARPFVRWWWNNNQIETQEALKELDLLKAAGIGGVEINPILEPAYSWDREKLSDKPMLKWGSAKWNQVVQEVAQGAKEKGMIVDLLAGSGWPFGGRFLEKEETIQRLSVLDQSVTGPQQWSQPLKEIIKQRRTYGSRKYQKPLKNPELYRIWMIPTKLSEVNQIEVLDLEPNADGLFEIDIPEGEHTLSFGFIEHGYRSVGNGVTGSSGPSLDHFSSSALQAFMSRVLGIGENWDQPMSSLVRAIFCDSIELAESNWTGDMLEAFRQQRGYDITPYLPFVIRAESDAPKLSADATETIRRARYDWHAHLVETFNQRFVTEFKRLCNEKGLLSRYQSYGNPLLMGLGEGYLIPDIPEGNNVLYANDNSPYKEDYFTHRQDYGYMLWTKYAAAGGRLKDRKVISTESMTNVLGFFQTTLATIKQADDMNFIAGMNHSVLHGYNHTPDDLEFPGFIRFGTFFSEHNTWWPYFKYWTDYNARLSAFFQSTRAAADVALLAPATDIWQQDGLDSRPFHTQPQYLHQMWENLSQLGLNNDYLHAAVIENADMSDGRLTYGPMSYPVLMIAERDTMRPETAEAIRDLARNGGKVVFIGQTPDKSPGLQNSAKDDQRVQQAIQAALAAGAHQIEAPARNADLTAWLNETFSTIDYTPPTLITNPDASVYQLRHQTADGNTAIFLTNTNRSDSSQTSIQLNGINAKSWMQWNPETGERTPFPTPTKDELEVTLTPLKSILLVSTQKPSASSPEESTTADPFPITGTWQVQLKPIADQPEKSIELPELVDFTQHSDPHVKSFSGTATYTIDFELSNDPNSYQHLDLGTDQDFITEVTLNDTPLGTNWYGSPVFELKDALKSGRNTLSIKYTTTLFNGMIGTEAFDRLWDKFQKNQEPAPIATGLTGPVRLR